MTNTQYPKNRRFVGQGPLPPGWSAPAPASPEEVPIDLPPTEEELEQAALLEETMIQNLQRAQSRPQATVPKKPANNAIPQPLNHNPLKMAKTSHTRHNPLAGYFRKPGISIRLPSGVSFYPPDQVQLTPTGELEIFPLTLSDELMLKTPDALLNGTALEQVVVSCAPGVKNPKRLLSPDLDAILLAMRSATYGNQMDVEARCPKCQHENTYSIDIGACLNSMVPLEHTLQVHLENGLVVVVQPFDFEAAVKATSAGFEQAKLIQVLQRNDVDDHQKMLATLEVTKKIADLQIMLVTSGIQEIILPSGEFIQDSELIAEWVQNTNRKDVELLEEEIKKLNSSGVTKQHEVTCSNCGNKWVAQMDYDPTSFFGKSSSK